MLAAVTTNSLALVSSSSLRTNPPFQVPSCCTLEARPTAISWSPDNTALFIASSQVIQKYDPSGKPCKTIYSSTESSPISSLLCKDKGNTLLFSIANKVHVFECRSGTGKISKTFESHKSNLTSLSLSHDSTILASTSADAAHVHNLTLSSHTVLRGLPLTGNQKIATSAFHPHSRARLLLGIGKQLVIYDTTRPSAPLKLVLMPDNTSGSGEIVAISCSPFSKTLVAVACSGGLVGIVDLEKDKSPRRNFNVKAPITSLLFSPEGDSIYVGTENGKVFVQSLRTLDKPPTAVRVSNDGFRVEGMSVQKKLNTADSAVVPKAGKTTTASAKLSDQQSPGRRPSAPTATGADKKPVSASAKVISNAKTRSPPTRPRTISDAAIGARARVASSTSVTPPKGQKLGSKLPTDRADANGGSKVRNVFSPVKDPLRNSGEDGGDISVAIDSLVGIDKPVRGEVRPLVTGSKENDLLNAQRSTTPGSDPVGVTDPAFATETRPISSASTGRTADTRPTKTTTSSRLRTTSTVSTRSNAVVDGNGRRMPLSTSDVTRVPSSSSGALNARSRPTSALSSRPISAMSRTVSSGSRASRHSPEGDMNSSGSSRRTPSPDLPSPDKEPMTPLPLIKARERKRKGLSVLGLGTPEVQAWIEAGKGKETQNGAGAGKRVGFAEAEDANQDTDSQSQSDEEDEKDTQEGDRFEKDHRELSMQISPRRAMPAWAPSPLRQMTSPGRGSTPQDLLHTIVRDVMYDFQRETKAEMMGLHLDLVRLGRSWKRELREVMEEYVGEMRDLREENVRLREENERFRRGF